MKEHKEKGVDLGLRQFIKSLGYVAGGTALLATTPWLTSCTPEKLQEIKHEKARIALIGTGSRGQYHIHNLKEIPHAQIVAVCDNYAPNLQQALELCPDAKPYTDYRKLLESKDIDGVIISTPLNWHAPIVLDALAAGKHVFCEKAMARTLDECKAIYDTYNQSDKVLYFCMQRMYDEKYIKGMQMIHSGLIGDVVGLRCHWFRNADWRRPVPSPELERKINWRLYKESSGGLMTELACHQLEVCNWAAQKMPESIMGMGDIVYWKDGLCHYSKSYAMVGVRQSGKDRNLEFQTNKEKITGPAIKGNKVWIKSVWGLDGKSQFSYSTDGRKFTPFGEVYQLEWGYYRGSRIGISCFNNMADAGYIDVDEFIYLY